MKFHIHLLKLQEKLWAFDKFCKKKQKTVHLRQRQEAGSVKNEWF